MELSNYDIEKLREYAAARDANMYFEIETLFDLLDAIVMDLPPIEEVIE